jgi:ADP-ribose pyrophosphatase
MEKFEILGKNLKQKGKIVDFYSYDVKVPNGKEVEWDVVEHKGAAAIVPVDDEGRIIMVRQYRGAIDDFLLEIPAGGRDSAEEDFKECAARELEEEIGYRSDEIHHLVDYLSAAAYTSEKIGIYYTEKLIPSKQNLDEDEFIQIERYTVDELVEMIANGEITDGKSIAAIMSYKVLRGK